MSRLTKSLSWYWQNKQYIQTKKHLVTQNIKVLIINPRRNNTVTRYYVKFIQSCNNPTQANWNIFKQENKKHNYKVAWPKKFQKVPEPLKRSTFGISIIQLEISVLSIRLGYWLKVFSNSVKWNWNARNVKHCLTTNCVELRFLCNAESEIIWIVDWTCSCLTFGMKHNNIFTLISQKRKWEKKMMYIAVDRDKRMERESPYLS